ncbi:MAG: hypothetical protein ACLR6W_07245 [Evtepia sp.]
MKKHDFTPFLALFGIFLLFVGFVLLLFLGQQEDRYAIVSFVILCLGCTLFGIGIGKWISHRLHSVLKESKSPKKAPPPLPLPSGQRFQTFRPPQLTTGAAARFAAAPVCS